MNMPFKVVVVDDDVVFEDRMISCIQDGYRVVNCQVFQSGLGARYIGFLENINFIERIEDE